MSNSPRIKHNRDHAGMVKRIAAGQPFKGSNFWGEPRATYDTGKMPDADAGVYDVYRTAGRVDYVIYSYNTPIAYHLTFINQWIIPPVKYSPATDKHQSMLYALPKEINHV